MSKLVTIDIGIPEDVYYGLKQNHKDLKQRLKEMIAIEGFRCGELSFGKAAKVAEMDKTIFMELLSRNKISVLNLTEEEFQKQLEISHSVAKRLRK